MLRFGRVVLVSTVLIASVSACGQSAGKTVDSTPKFVEISEEAEFTPAQAEGKNEPNCLIVVSQCDSTPKFVEISKKAGFTLAQGERKSEPNCLFSPDSIAAKFPKVTPPAASRDVVRQCDPERSAGGAAAIDINSDGLEDIVMTRMYGTPLLYINESTKGSPSFRDATKGSAFEKYLRRNKRCWLCRHR